jgi:hypothetical protein
MASPEIAILAVPEQWQSHSLVRDETSYHKIIGIEDAIGRISVPDSPSKYFYGGGYRQGYSKSDISELTLSLSNEQINRLSCFFRNFLVGQHWYDLPLTAERYDCHWFSTYMAGWHSGNIDTGQSLTLTEQVVSKGKKDQRLVTSGQLGVIGANHASRTTADHSIIGLVDGNCLQVMGMHDALAISPQDQTTQHYLENSDAFDQSEDKQKYGLHVAHSN